MISVPTAVQCEAWTTWSGEPYICQLRGEGSQAVEAEELEVSVVAEDQGRRSCNVSWGLRLGAAALLRAGAH